MICILRSDFSKIKDILKRREHCEINFSGENILKSRIILCGEPCSEVYIISQGKNLILRRIELKNKRKGTGTLIVKELLKIAKNKGFERLVIENVLSREMANLCIKMSFEKEDNEFEFDNGYIGNYFKNV